MNRKTHTFFELPTDGGSRWTFDNRKLQASTLLKRGAINAYYQDIDLFAISKGYFSRIDIIVNGKEVL